MASSARIRHYMHDNGPLILDGGLATELEAQGVKLQVRHKKKITALTSTFYFLGGVAFLKNAETTTLD